MKETDDSVSKTLLSDLKIESFTAIDDVTNYTTKELREVFNSDLGYYIYISGYLVRWIII